MRWLLLWNNEKPFYIPNEYTYLYAPIRWDVKDRWIYHIEWYNRNMTITPTNAISNWTDSALLRDYTQVEEEWWLVPPLSMVWRWKAIWTHASPDHPILMSYYNWTYKNMYAIWFLQDNSQAFMTYLQETIAWNDVPYVIDTTERHCYWIATDWPNWYFYIDWQLVATKTNRPTTWWPAWWTSCWWLLNRWWWNILNWEWWWFIIESRLNNQQRFLDYYNKTKDFYLNL